MSNPIVKLPEPFVDARGSIQNIFTDGMQSGALITSIAGSQRARHFHRQGNHLCLLISGKLIYRWRPVGSDGLAESLRILPGMAFFTPDMVEHQMDFTEDSVFLAFDSKISRTRDGYEEDTVKLVRPLL